MSDSIIIEGAISVLSALNSDYCKVIKIILKDGIKYNSVSEILTCAKAKNVETQFISEDEMRELTQNYSDFTGNTHGGIIAITSKRKFLSLNELILTLPKNKEQISIALIEGIEDPYNLGYAARALYTQGTNGLIIPERDFGFSEAVIEKSSTGTFSKMPVTVFGKASDAKRDLIELLKNEKFKIYCIDKKLPANSKVEFSDIFNVKFADRTVFIIGGEKRGISKDFLDNADEIVRIPYAKEFPHSLAAQTAATIAAYEIHRQRNRGN